jgi:hypothetical protein
VDSNGTSFIQYGKKSIAQVNDGGIGIQNNNYLVFGFLANNAPKEEKSSWQKDVHDVSLVILCFLGTVDVFAIYTLISSGYNPDAFFVILTFTVAIAVDILAVTIGKNNAKTVMAALMLSATAIWIAGVLEHGFIFVLSLSAAIGIGVFALLMRYIDKRRSELDIIK